MIIGELAVFISMNVPTYLRAPAGSAVHALAQRTPLGEGPEGFSTVLNDAIITTEKVCSCHHNVQLAVKA